MLTAAMLMVLSYFDIFMLSYFRTSGEVGSYNVVYPLAELLTATLGIQLYRDAHPLAVAFRRADH